MTDPTPLRLLVLISADGRPLATADRAATLASERPSPGDPPVTIDVVVTRANPASDPASLFQRVSARIESVLPNGHDAEIQTRSLDLADTDPRDNARALVEALEGGDRSPAAAGDVVTDGSGVTTVVLDPDLTALSAASLEETLGSDIDVVVPEEETARTGREPLIHPTSAGRLLSIFALSLLFYLAIGWSVKPYEVITGVVSAGVTALVLGRIAMTRAPTLGRTGRRLLRSLAFVPVLAWEVAKANLVIAAVILHPSLPIDPDIVTADADADDDFERATLANAITLTPGTVTIDVRGDELHVHTLTSISGTDLLAGRVPRFVRYVFRGHPASTTTDGTDSVARDGSTETSAATDDTGGDEP